jgi:hypothetical protein
MWTMLLIICHHFSHVVSLHNEPIGNGSNNTIENKKKNEPHNLVIYELLNLIKPSCNCHLNTKLFKTQ